MALLKVIELLAESKKVGKMQHRTQSCTCNTARRGLQAIRLRNITICHWNYC